MRSALRIAATLLAIAPLAAQSPKTPPEIAQRQFPDMRQIGAYYFDGMNESQVWINVEPEHVERGADPIIFNATVKFSGLRLLEAPATVDLRPQVRCLPPVYLARPRLPVFRVTIGSDPKIDWSPDGRTSFFLPSCGGGPEGTTTFDTVSTQVPFAMLRRLADAPAVTVEAIGFTVRFRPEDSAALQTLVRTVEHGVALKR